MTKVTDLNQYILEKMYAQQLKSIFILHNNTTSWNELINEGEDNNDNNTSK